MKNSKPRLAIVTTHPIQYNAPLFQLIASRGQVACKVFYTWSQARNKVFDPGFAREREWDIPLLEGYDYSFVENKANRPGSHHFWGVRNPALIREIDGWKPDVILVFGWSFWSHVRCLLHYNKKIHVFFRGDSTLLDESGLIKPWIRRRVLTWVYQHIDVAFYVGANNKAYFEKHGVGEGRLIHAPHAIDNIRFSIINKVGEEEVKRWRKDLGFAEDDFVVLFIGKLELKKNPAFILRLAEKMVDADLKFLLVGDGPLEKQLKASCLDRRITFLDFQNQSKMPLVYRLGNLLVLPSKGPGETWGLAANEAMASGLPIALSTKVGGAPDLVNQNGIIFPPDDIKLLVTYIQELKQHPRRLVSAKQKSREWSQNFTLEKIASVIESTVKARTAKGVDLTRKMEETATE